MIRNILCAADGSTVSAKAVDYAIELAKKLRVPLTVLSVELVSREDMAQSPFWDSKVLEASASITRTEFENVSQKAQSAGLENVSCVVVSSRHVAEAIAAYAESNGFDQIVMGSHGHTGVSRMILGSTAYAVVARANCPVTIVR
ncbi:universal stress protein [Methyloceanibacter methanicus]|uniref:universal stress protein n=1 Tax=Methyloceanibacter methanicus TaxID=1774968 RepID=UPI001FCDF004|nr:universal stress protein [Methyloceanibacter methanicus]